MPDYKQEGPSANLDAIRKPDNAIARKQLKHRHRACSSLPNDTFDPAAFSILSMNEIFHRSVQ